MFETDWEEKPEYKEAMRKRYRRSFVSAKIKKFFEKDPVYNKNGKLSQVPTGYIKYINEFIYKCPHEQEEIIFQIEERFDKPNGLTKEIILRRYNNKRELQSTHIFDRYIDAEITIIDCCE